MAFDLKGTKAAYLRVPYGLSVHGEEEIAAVVNVLRTSTQMGEHVRAMETKVAKLFDNRLESWSIPAPPRCSWRLKF